ncbi:hypothetical protein Q8A73_006262 [Channa argus]|nr:hypothetical protein Q8A73_006262 [Channa argus]
MAFANQGRTIPRVGLRRTLRFQWRSSDREVMPRDLFCTRIIKGQLNLTVEDFFCIQWHQQATGYDVSFVSAETHQAVTARCARLANKHPLNLCEVVNMDRPNFRIISVHMFNPFMTDLASKEFFGCFSDVVSAARYVGNHKVSGPVVDSSRFCCTQMFPVLLHPDAEGVEGLQHPLCIPLQRPSEQTPVDECVVRALELFEDFGRVSGARLNIGKCTVKGGGRGMMLLRVDYQRGHALLYVFPLPVAIRRPLARTIFDFLWGGRYEGILNWSNVGPRSEQLPWHYAWVAKWLRAHPEALKDGIWKQQRVLYRVVRGKVNPSPLLGVPSSVWVGVQAVGLSNGLKDLNWACLHRTLPVRDTIHRHGVGRSPLCLRPSCGAGETAYHVMWECSFARQLWAKAKKVVGRAKPDLTLTWQVVERSFVGAHIRSGWGILWLLLSLYKRGPWLVRQELVRSGVEWSTERVAKGVESEVTERIKWEVDKLGYHAAKEK